MKKTLLLVLTVCMIAVMVPASLAFAEESETPADEVLTEESGGEAEVVSLESKLRMNEGEDGWTKDATTGKWMYYLNGAPVTGKQLIGTWHFFDQTGLMVTGWQNLDDGTKNYYETEGTNPATDKLGSMHTGWLTWKKGKYYFDVTDGAMYTGLKTIKGNKYFFDTNTGKMQTGWKTIDEDKYYFNPKNGKMKTGWLKLSGSKYYLDKKTGKMKTGWVKIENDKYYFTPSSGKMKTGWLTLNGKKYRLDPKSGKMETGFKGISGKKYYFDSNGVMQTGLKTIKGYKYYFNSKGVMQTGAHKISGALYYFYSSGKAVKNKGWFKGSDKKQRYSLGGGKVATGEKKIGNTWYTFDNKTGVLTGSMDQIDKNIQNKSSKTKYFIQVIKKNHQVRVYTGKKGSWKKVYTFTCSIGDSQNPTPSGTFKIYQKLKKHEVVDDLSGVKVRCWGLCRFYKDDTGKQYALNSIIYRASDGSVYDGRLGINNSKGSVRLSYNNAMWVFYNAPINTTVYIP